MPRALPWFRLYTETVDDEKLRLLAFEDRWHYIAILCCKGAGLIDDPCDPKMRERKLAVKLGVQLRELDELHRRLMDVGLVDGDWQPAGWESRRENRPPAHEWRVLRQAVFERDDYTCQYCGNRGVRLECDHVMPVARGGSHEMTNLKTSCFNCNRSKRDKLLSEWLH